MSISLPRCAALLLLALSCALGLSSNHALAASKTVVAPAQVYFLDAAGHHISRARAKHPIQFVLRFSVPTSFPAGYTDLRFTVYVHGKAQRTIIYGTPKHALPGHTLQVAVLVPVSKTWIGKVGVVGIVTLYTKPNGAPLNHLGRGTASLTVTR